MHSSVLSLMLAGVFLVVAGFVLSACGVRVAPQDPPGRVYDSRSY